MTEDSVLLRVHQYDRTAQTFIRQTIIVSNDGVQLKPFGMHYRWPEQIDDLATQAGLRLDARYADWHREPFGQESRSYISVYRKP